MAAAKEEEEGGIKYNKQESPRRAVPSERARHGEVGRRERRGGKGLQFVTNEETKAASGEQEGTGRVIIGLLPRVIGWVVEEEGDCQPPQESAVKARAKSEETGWGVNFTIL